ncbi:gliding motility-associated C-terminal domain-containing protein [Robertkochia solimangrovi]|uniref:T9SS type B sorting domain-containing protein n=1 Tax=Robertkochia solimangrovi TaxID=2213046 RepID=UPI0011816FB0|nr:gliding motility-associated C-terminal domain-containing protein [Robertkochia solimangrovi]TRZ46051.1 gliding motility-associated C-terminal domain-containing protein [Robertkochia solimangrovi]
MNLLRIPKTVCLLMVVACASGVTSLRAQELQKPVLGFSDACASTGFNSFAVSFSWNPTKMVDSTNEFVLELSDVSGSFSNPVELSRLSDKNTTFDFDFNFAMPESVSGNSYKVRVRSTKPALTSPASDVFTAHYLKVTDALVVNNYEEQAVCEETTVFLSVDNYPDEKAYNWYKDMVLIPGEKEASIEVSEPGIYFAEVDYGEYCSVSTASNLVEVFIEASVGIELIGDSEIFLCEGETYSLTTNFFDPDMTYAWYKDGELLEKTSNNSYEIDASNADFEGVYYVELEKPSGGCTETSNNVKLTATGVDLTLSNSGGNTLYPGQTITLSASTSAEVSKYEWYKDNTLITDATGASLDITEAGSYYVKIFPVNGCVSEKKSETITIGTASGYVAEITADDYTSCASEVTLSLNSVSVDTENGYETLDESSLQSFSYQWVYNGNDLEGKTERTLVLDENALNGAYALKVMITESEAIESNAMNIVMGVNEIPVIIIDGEVSCDGGTAVTLTASVLNTDYVYTWYKDGQKLSATGSSMQTTSGGLYSVKITRGNCSAMSEAVTIDGFDEEAVQIDAPDTIILNEGDTKIVSASGAESYQWFDADYNQLSSSSSVTLSTEGEYILKAMVGSCEVMKVIKVVYQLSYAVPNVITPNGDGVNDLWVLPSAYAYNPEINVNIYTQAGTQIFSVTDYQNNWPQSGSITYQAGNPPVYYYRITRGKETLKQGTITVIK